MHSLAYLALLGRIILMGAERPLVKMLGTGRTGVDVAFLFFFIATILLLPFTLFHPVTSWSFLTYLIPAGFIYALAFVLYVKALGMGEVSLLAPLNSFNVLFLFILAVPILGESFTVTKFFGIFLIFGGTAFLSGMTNPLAGFLKIVKDKASLLMLFSTFLVAVGRIIDKSAAADPLTYSFFLYLLTSLLLFIYLLAIGRLAFSLSLFRERPMIALACGFTNAYAYLLLLVALQTVEVSIAEPVASLSLLLAVLLGKVFFREEIHGRLVSAAVMILGVWVLVLG
jgi:bacterial/archaeal transporter family protein